MTPGVKFSTTTSAVLTNACTMARASGAFRFSVRLRLPMIARQERRRHAGIVATRHQPPRLIAGAGLFDLDDIGAELRELLRRERSGEYLGEIDDSNAVERARQKGMLFRNRA